MVFLKGYALRKHRKDAMIRMNLGRVSGNAPVPSSPPDEPAQPAAPQQMQRRRESPLQQLPADLHRAIADHLGPRNALALAQVNSTLRCSLGEHAKAGLLAQRARVVGRLCALQGFRDILGTPRDADGRGGSGILGLPTSLRPEPLRELSFSLIYARLNVMGERARSTTLLAQHAVEAGADPQTIEHLIQNFDVMPHSSEALTALRILWHPINAMPLAHRHVPLLLISGTVERFPLRERAERFAEHLAAWEELVAADPSSARATPTQPSLLDGELRNMVTCLPRDRQDEACGRIAAMKEVVGPNEQMRVPPSDLSSRG